MSVLRRLLLLFAPLAALCFSPIIVGAFTLFPTAFVAFALLVFAAYAFGLARSPRPKQVALVLLSACFAVTLFDLSVRPFLFQLFDVRPTERLIYRWPPLPLLQRYVAGESSEWTTYGDLAGMSGRRDWRETRRVQFVTDAYGFRNEPAAGSEQARVLDVIMLGDSFGVAGGTTQKEMLSGMLEHSYGLSVYNLSISRENPQQEYANLLIEGRRLKTREGTVVLWLIFTGNDLDEPYHPALRNPQPKQPGLRARLGTGFVDFRLRSPVRRLLSRGGEALVIERQFIDGGQMLFFAPYAENRRRTPEEIRRHTNFESLSETLDAMRKLAGERRLKVLVALVPSKEEVYAWTLDGSSPWSTSKEPSGFSVVMRELSERAGFRFLDLKPALVEASERVFKEKGELLWWRDDTHWNAAGQREAAASIHASLLEGDD